MKTLQKTPDRDTVERWCSVCRRLLVVQTVHDYLDRGAAITGYLGHTEKLERLSDKLGGQQLLTWCSVCFRYGLPSEALTA